MRTTKQPREINMIKSIMVLGFSLFSVAVSAAELNVYWSTDGAANARVTDLAQQFQAALQRDAGIDAKVIVASAAVVSQAAEKNQVDILITCNEVDSDRGAPLERLSQHAAGSLTCMGGSNKGAWTLASDQDVERGNSGELWVYFMRSSQHFSQFLGMRNAVQSIRQQLSMDSIVTAAAE